MSDPTSGPTTTPQPTPVQGMSHDDVATHYNFPANQGQGVTVGILGWGGIGKIGVDTAQVTKVLTGHGLPAPNFVVTCLGKQTNTNAIDGELHMDTSIVGWYVPQATAINIYIATEDTVADAIARAVADGCTVTTSSFAIHQASLVDGVADALVAAAQAGVTTCFAAGDSGAGSGGFVDEVAFPAAHPNALAVGGTFIPSGPPPQPTTCGTTPTGVEQVWWNYPASGAGPSGRTWWAGGGGVSKLYGVPDYQRSIDPTSFPVDGKTYSGRGLPDVAAMAQGNGLSATSSGWVGTSASTPTFASLIARINSALGYAVGDIHDVIYDLPSGSTALTSLTDGCNVPPPGQRNAGLGYTARAGWDACTGLGIPDGVALQQALAAARPR